MDRRTFLHHSAVLALLGLGGTVHGDPERPAGVPDAVLVPPLPPLDHKGAIDIRVRIPHAATQGRFSAVETAVAPRRMGPSPHAHQRLDELMFVLEGTEQLLVGEEIVTVPAGGWHLRPRLLRHTFWNPGDTPLRFIDMYFDEPFDDYLEELFHRLTPENGFPEDSPARLARLRELAEIHGLIRFPDAREQRHALMTRYGLQ